MSKKAAQTAELCTPKYFRTIAIANTCIVLVPGTVFYCTGILDYSIPSHSHALHKGVRARASAVFDLQYSTVQYHENNFGALEVGSMTNWWSERQTAKFRAGYTINS